MATPTAFTDAQGQNDIDRNVRQYSDLDLFFAKKSGSKDVRKVTDIQAVKRSVRNLVLLNHYEKPFHPEIGSNVRSILFEPVSSLVADVLKRYVEDVINNFEPRAELIDVNVNAQIDRNAYEVEVKFYLVNSPSGLQTVNLFLEGLR